MSGTALEHPLIRGYLRELDAALAGSPIEHARELREQITAHLEDALPAGAGEQKVAAALARLGSPASLAAEARAGRPTPSPAARATRRMFAALSRQTWRFWSIAAATVILVGFPTGYATAVLTAGALQPGPGEGWWYLQDATHDVNTSADAVQQDTVAIRPGQRQGLFFTISNPTDWTQTVLGPADHWAQSLGSTFGQFRVSARGSNWDGSPVDPRTARYGLPGDIPPHQSRVLRILWTSRDCMQQGAGNIMDRVILRVRIGWTTRTETILLNQAWALAGTAQSDCSRAPVIGDGGLGRQREVELNEAAVLGDLVAQVAGRRRTKGARLRAGRHALGIQAHMLDADDISTLVPVDRVPDRHVLSAQMQLVGARQGSSRGKGSAKAGTGSSSPHASASCSRANVGGSSPGPGSAWMRSRATRRPTSRRSRLSSAFRESSSARGMLTISDASTLARSSSVRRLHTKV